MSDMYSIPLTTIDGARTSLEQYRGKVLLIVNVASKCGFTSQYTGLEALYQKYKEQGLVVLGFPCNQFGSQESGTETEIKQFCSLTYNVSFPMFAKVEVVGENAHPLFALLSSAAPGIFGTESIKWNFTKFLVARDGRVSERFSSIVTPEALTPAVEALLELPAAPRAAGEQVLRER